MPCDGPRQLGLFKSPHDAYLYIADIVMQRIKINLSDKETDKKVGAALMDVQLAVIHNDNLQTTVDEMARIIKDLNGWLEAKKQAVFGEI